jgi:hypothetical protein
MATLLKAPALLLVAAAAGCTDLRLLDHDKPFFPATLGRWQPRGHRASLRREGEGVRFESSIPMRASVCRGSLPGEEKTCLDADGDGLADEWERALLDRWQPLLRLHRAEPMLGDARGRAVALGRVYPVDEPEGHVRALIALLYHRDYGRCSFTGHRGDVERVALDLVEREGHLALAGAYTAAHEYTAFDGSRLRTTADELGELDFVRDETSGEVRWRVHVSSGKHATYTSREACAGHAAAICAREDCPGPGEAGEDVLTDIGWAGEPPPACDGPQWSDRPFCGLAVGYDGMDSTPCAPPIKEKLLRDPFAGHREVHGPGGRPADPEGCPDRNVQAYLGR